MSFSDIQFEENSDPRSICVLILDSSSSMAEVMPGESESPMEALNRGLEQLVGYLSNDPLARRRVELLVVPYGSNVAPVDAENDFRAVTDGIVLPNLVPSGVTSTGEAIRVALDAVDARKEIYKSNSVAMYRPMVFLLSDGLSTDDTSESAARIRDLEANKKIAFFPIGVGNIPDVGMEELAKVGGKAALKLDGLKFDELFQWVSASLTAVSASQPGDRVALEAPTGWAEI